MVWFEEAIPLFTAVKFDGKNLPSKEFFEAALNCRKIYQYVWGGGMICRQLEKDLDGSAGPCLQAYNHNPEGFPFVAQAPEEHLQGVEGFKKGLDVRLKLLWCNRALRFIVSILTKLMMDPALEVHIAAKATYNDVLAPHHSWAVRQVARTALSQCPWRRNMLAKLEMDNAEFIQQATKLLSIMVPQVTHVHQALVDFGLETLDCVEGTSLPGAALAAATLETGEEATESPEAAAAAEAAATQAEAAE